MGEIKTNKNLEILSVLPNKMEKQAWAELCKAKLHFNPCFVELF